MNDRKALLCSMAAALHQQTTKVDIAVNLALAIEAEVDKRLKKENQTYKEEQPLTKVDKVLDFFSKGSYE